jgi:hypothetical protein
MTDTSTSMTRLWAASRRAFAGNALEQAVRAIFQESSLGSQSSIRHLSSGLVSSFYTGSIRPGMMQQGHTSGDFAKVGRLR